MVGTPALHVAQKIGVIDAAGEIGVLVIDADGEEVPAIANLAIKGMHCELFNGTLMVRRGRGRQISGHTH